MIPLRDNFPSIRTPYVNYALIAVNTVCFLLAWATGPYFERLLMVLGFVPDTFMRLLGHLPQSLKYLFIPMFTSFFLHTGWLHLLGNMWFLFIFGDNVEDTLGPFRYLLFYLLCGLGANLIYLAIAPHSPVPLVGASGAIAGVMGAYFNLFPGARILTLIPIFFLPTFWELPAYIFLGYWLFLQFLLGAFTGVGAQAGGGVAWWAHIGGFLVGIVLLHLFIPHLARPQWRQR